VVLGRAGDTFRLPGLGKRIRQLRRHRKLQGGTCVFSSDRLTVAMTHGHSGVLVDDGDEALQGG